MNSAQLQQPVPTLLIGVGNALRHDDGVGIRVAEALRSRVADVTVRTMSGEGSALLAVWGGYDRVLVVDATRSGAPPGTCVELAAHLEPIPARFFHYSSHTFGVAEAVELARVLEQMPAELWLVGIEGERWDAGEGLSPAVEQAAHAVIARLATRLETSGHDG